jgi:hypothetical protein
MITAQDFLVVNITGNAAVLKGTGEEWSTIVKGDRLSGEDLIATDANSKIILSKGEEKFVLNANSALNLGYIKKMSINDLLLALALEDFKNLPVNKQDEKVKDTAVYGDDENNINRIKPVITGISNKKINGAIQLSQVGYKQSSVVAAREIFRNYPETADGYKNRVYFADILVELSLYEEAMEEYNKIAKLKLSEKESSELQNKLSELKDKILTVN